MCANLPDYLNIKLAVNIAESYKNSIVYLRSSVTPYESLIGIDSLDVPPGLGSLADNVWDVEKQQENENTSEKEIRVAKYIYGGFFDDISFYAEGDYGKDLGVVSQKILKKGEKPAYMNIHLFNELLELKAQGRLLSELIYPEFVNFGESEGFITIPDRIIQQYDFKIE